MTLLRNVKLPSYITLFLDDVGDGTGTANIVGNYLPQGGGIPVEFRTVAPPRVDYHIYSIQIELYSLAMNRFGYGDYAGGLVNGLILTAQERETPEAGGSYVPFLRFGSQLGGIGQGQVVKLQSDWGIWGFEMLDDVARIQANPALVPQVVLTLDMVKRYGSPLVLRGNREGKLALTASDDFSNATAVGANMVRHQMMVRGLAYPNSVITEGLAGN